MKVSLLLLLSIVLLACSNKQNDTTTVYLVRHFEKNVQKPQSTHDVGLSELGQSNALLLASFLQDKNIEEVYSTDYTRTIQSARPTAEKSGVNIIIYQPKDLASFANALAVNGSNKLVVGHSNTTGELFALLGCEQTSLSENDYQDIFLVRFANINPQSPIECTRFKLNTSN